MTAYKNYSTKPFYFCLNTDGGLITISKKKIELFAQYLSINPQWIHLQIYLHINAFYMLCPRPSSEGSAPSTPFVWNYWDCIEKLWSWTGPHANSSFLISFNCRMLSDFRISRELGSCPNTTQSHKFNIQYLYMQIYFLI